MDDNAALYHALKSGYPVLLLFIFDTTILQKLEDKKDKRVVFIHQQIQRLNSELIVLGSSMLCYHGNVIDVWKKLITEFTIKEVYTNHDYEPYAIERDEAVRHLLTQNAVLFHTYKDQVLFEKGEVVKEDGLPYTVYTPFSKKWMQKLNAFYLKSYPTEKYFNSFLKTKPLPIPTLNEIGFENISVPFPTTEIAEDLIRKYGEQRNFPAINGTSRISIHLRFGTAFEDR